MPQCAKCGKTVKIFYGSWKYKDSFPEFYNKPLCISCYNELDSAREESARETAIEELREHLRQIGLDATLVTFKKLPILDVWRLLSRVEEGRVMGAVRVANRNIDLIELVEWSSLNESGQRVILMGYRCNFVVHARVDGLEDKLKADLRPIRTFPPNIIVGVIWEGKELAQMLNRDTNLKDTLYRIKYRDLEIKPYREHQCIRIKQKDYHHLPQSAFPTLEAFEAADRIAHHVRSMAEARP